MTLHLGVDIGDERTAAAVERDGRTGVVRLGTDVTVPSVAHVAADGVVTVGDAAVAHAATDPEGLVTGLARRLGDPAPFLVHGLEVDGPLLIGHLLADIVATVTARYGRRPDTVRLAHPDGWSEDRVRTLVAAAEAAGLTGVSALSVSAARAALGNGGAGDAGGPEGAAHAGALGAALAGVGPSVPTGREILTREDLEGPAPPPPLRPVPVFDTSAPRSVFDEAPASTAAMPVVAGAGGTGVPAAGVGDGGDEPGGRARWIWAAVAGLAVVVAVLVIVLLAVSGGDDDVDTVPETTVPETTVPETTVPDTTVETTTTLAPTTTEPGTTTTSSTTTTTTAPVTRPLALADFGLVLRPGLPTRDDLLFGEEADTAVNLVRGLFGAPSADTGWVEDGDCEGAKARRVRWGALEIVLLQEGADGAPDRTRRFAQWYVDNTSDLPAGLATPEGVGVGSRVSALDAAYGDSFQLEVGTGGRGHFEIEGPSDGFVEGVTSGIAPVDVVLRMWSGYGCERFL
jgi:hypothetical protein